MLAKERQNSISQMIKSSGAVSTNELVKEFGVSIESIRRDLLTLEKEGKLTRVHGGAIGSKNMKPYPTLEQRNIENKVQKKRLSKTAAAYVRNGDIIGIDTGSTAVAFSEALKKRNLKLTVVTHSMDVFDILRDEENITVILCGGHYVRNENAFCGPLALDILDKLHLNKVFIFPSTISLSGGICDYNPDLLQIQKRLIHISEAVYILADSSKFEKHALMKISDIKKDFIYITDPELPPKLKKLYHQNGIHLYDGDE